MTINFSIIMPNYNSKFLERAIKSVFNQSYSNWELIIIDNFSNNNPEDVIKKFKNEKISFLKFRNNNNIAKSRNYGIKNSKYDWIAFLDSDDVWEKDKLFCVQKNIEKKNPDIIYHGMYFLPKKMGFIKKVINDKSKKIDEPVYETLLKFGNKIANSSVVVKKKKLLEIDLISELSSKYSWEDYDCWIRLAAKKNTFSFIDRKLGFCWNGLGRVSNNNQSYKNCKNFMKIYQNELKNIQSKKIKRPKWISRTYSNFYFDQKSYIKAYYFLKQSQDKKIKTLFKILYIAFIIFILLKCIKKIGKIFNNFKKIFNKIILFDFDKTEIAKQKELPENINFKFYVFKEYKELRNYNNFFFSFENREFLKRFKKSHEMIALIDDKSKNIACYGWKSTETPHIIEEINKKFFFDDGSILYDFRTLSNYKNKKLYKLLLSKITQNFKKPLYIYSLSGNNFSINAINKTGFNLLKKLNIFSNDFNKKNFK